MTEEANEQAQQAEANPSQAPAVPEYLLDLPPAVPEYLPDFEAIEESRRMEGPTPQEWRSEEDPRSRPERPDGPLRRF